MHSQNAPLVLNLSFKDFLHQSLIAPDWFSLPEESLLSICILLATLPPAQSFITLSVKCLSLFWTCYLLFPLHASSSCTGRNDKQWFLAHLTRCYTSEDYPVIDCGNVLYFNRTPVTLHVLQQTEWKSDFHDNPILRILIHQSWNLLFVCCNKKDIVKFRGVLTSRVTNKNQYLLLRDYS